MIEFRVKYDPRADVLYVSTERNAPAYAREGEDGIVWRYRHDDGTLVGVTIMDFRAYWKQHLGDLVDQVAAQFSIPAKAARSALEHVDD